MEDLKERVRRAIDSYNAHKVDAEDYAEDAEFVAPGRGPAKGKRAIADYWKQQLESFPDAKVTVDRIISEGDTVVVEYAFTGTNTGPLRLPSGEVLPATNRKVTGPGLDIVTFERGKITSHHQYFDQVPAFVQLGLMPAPAGAPA